MKVVKKLIAGVALMLVVGMILSPAVFAAGEATVTCTVTPELISVTVNPTGVDYGILGNSANATSGVITATNNGNVAEDFDIRGANATSGTDTWTLAGSVGADQYMHEFGLGSSPSTFTALATSGQDLANNIAASVGTQDFKLKIWTPSSSTGSGQYNTDVTVLAVKH